MEDTKEQQLKCPRCESTNTKFCYYNNYNLAQPRHFCKSCRRYWTHGGALRNVPVGGGTRSKSAKRASSYSSSAVSKRAAKPASPTTPRSQPPVPEPVPFAVGADVDHGLLDFAGSFSSLLASTGQFGSLFEAEIGGPTSRNFVGYAARGAASELQGSTNSSGVAAEQLVPEGFLGMQGDSSCWGGGWPDLTI